MKRLGAMTAIAAVAAVLVGVITSPGILQAHGGRGQAGGLPSGLTVYGRTLWNLEALLHDTYGHRTACLRLRDDAFVSSSCGDFADYGYWKDIFVAARHSHFRLVRRSRPPALGNVSPVTVRGAYVFCASFPVAFAPLAGSRSSQRWLVVLHGWAMQPFTCL